jgi:general stress protein 26
LNISTDHGSKLSTQVETYLNSKFPITAPNKSTKEKQLFSTLLKSNTPKNNKQPLRANLALMTTLGDGSKHNNKYLATNKSTDSGQEITHSVSNKLKSSNKPKTAN